MPSTIEPGSDLGRVKADQPPDLQVGYASLGNEPANVADAHPEPLGELVDGEELGQGFGTGHRSSAGDELTWARAHRIVDCPAVAIGCTWQPASCHPRASWTLSAELCWTARRRKPRDSVSERHSAVDAAASSLKRILAVRCSAGVLLRSTWWIK
jgi:hypothetical protein